MKSGTGPPTTLVVDAFVPNVFVRVTGPSVARPLICAICDTCSRLVFPEVLIDLEEVGPWLARAVAWYEERGTRPAVIRIRHHRARCAVATAALDLGLEVEWPASGVPLQKDVPLERFARLIGCAVDRLN